MVTVIQNGRKIEIPGDVWQTLKQWPDLSSAPQSVKNLARAHGIEVPKIVVSEKKSSPEFMKKVKQKVEGMGYDFNTGQSTEEGYLFRRKPTQPEKFFHPDKVFPTSKPDYLLLKTKPEAFKRPKIEVHLPNRNIEKINQTTNSKLSHLHSTISNLNDLKRAGEIDKDRMAYVEYEFSRPFAPQKIDNSVLSAGKGFVYAFATAPFIPIDITKSAAKWVKKHSPSENKKIIEEKGVMGFGGLILAGSENAIINFGKNYVSYIKEYPTHAIGATIAYAFMPTPKFIPKIKLPKMFSKLSIITKQKLKIPIEYKITKLQGVISAGGRTVVESRNKFYYVKQKLYKPITYTFKQKFKSSPKAETFAFNLNKWEYVKSIYGNNEIVVKGDYVGAFWKPIKSNLGKKIVWKTAKNVKKTPFKLTTPEYKPVSASALARSKIYAAGKEVYTAAPTKSGTILKVVGKATTKTKPKFFEPIISAEPVYHTYTVSPTVAASVLGVRPSELSAIAEKPKFETSTKTAIKQLLKLKEKPKGEEKTDSIFKPSMSLRIAAASVSTVKTKTTAAVKSKVKEKIRQRTTLTAKTQIPALFKLKSAFFGYESKATHRVEMPKFRIRIKKRKHDYASLLGTKKWKPKYTGLSDLIFSAAKGKKKIEPAARKLKIKTKVVKRGKKKKKKASILNLIR